VISAGTGTASDNSRVPGNPQPVLTVTVLILSPVAGLLFTHLRVKRSRSAV